MIMSPTLNEELVVEFVKFTEEVQRRSPRTVRTYAYVLDLYLRWLAGKPIIDVTVEDVEEFGRRQRGVLKASTATIRNNIVIVRCFHSWLFERKGMPVAPLRTVVIPQAPKARPKPMDDDVWRKVWLSQLEPADRLWLGLGFFAGLRRIEIVTLECADVDLERQELSLVRKGGVHANVEYGAIYGLLSDALPHLVGEHDWCAMFSDWVGLRQLIREATVWPSSRCDVEQEGNALNKRCEAISRRLSLPTGALTPHRLRHSCATNLLRAGIEVGHIQRQLSHSSINMTQRYLQFSGELARARQQRKEP